MSDLIERKGSEVELIKINPNNRPYYSDDFIKGFECGAKRQFEADKKARPKREWIFRGDGKAICADCGKSYDWDSEAQYYNYCPECGADMREREGE